MPYLTLYLTEEIGTSAALAGVLLALFSIGACAGTPLGGVGSDRLGRRPVMIAGLAGSGAAAVVFGFASDVWLVGAMIVVWGIFSSLFDPAASAYVADVAPPELRTEAFGLKRLVNNASFALGVLLGALLVWIWSLRVPFVVAGVLALVYLGVVWRGVPESRPDHVAHAEPARFREGLRDRLLVTLAVAATLVWGLYSFYEGGVPVFLREERGLALATWGAIFAINPVLVTVFQYPVARWAARRPARLALAAGALSSASRWPSCSLQRGSR